MDINLPRDLYVQNLTSDYTLHNHFRYEPWEWLEQSQRNPWVLYALRKGDVNGDLVPPPPGERLFVHNGGRMLMLCVLLLLFGNTFLAMGIVTEDIGGCLLGVCLNCLSLIKFFDSVQAVRIERYWTRVRQHA